MLLNFISCLFLVNTLLNLTIRLLLRIVFLRFAIVFAIWRLLLARLYVDENHLRLEVPFPNELVFLVYFYDPGGLEALNDLFDGACE